MRVSLSIGHRHPAVVTVEFVNDTEHAQFLAEPRVEPAHFDGDHFQVEPWAPYLGVQVKRTPYRPDEMLTLEPGASLSRVVNLAEMYDLSRLTSAKVRYLAFHPVNGHDDMMVLTSPWLDVRVQ